MKYESIKKQLLKRRSQWKAIAVTAELSVATLRRIATQEDYLPSLRTLQAVEIGLRDTPR